MNIFVSDQYFDCQQSILIEDTISFVFNGINLYSKKGSALPINDTDPHQCLSLP